MRGTFLLALSVAMPLAACVPTEGAVTSPDDLRLRQQAACSAQIAAHIRRPVAEVTSRWISETDGIATIEARDGNRPHLCRVDATGQVLGFVHPGA